MPVWALGKSNGSPRIQGMSREEEGRQPQASPSSQQIPLFWRKNGAGEGKAGKAGLRPGGPDPPPGQTHQVPEHSCPLGPWRPQIPSPSFPSYSPLLAPRNEEGGDTHPLGSYSFREVTRGMWKS